VVTAWLSRVVFLSNLQVDLNALVVGERPCCCAQTVVLSKAPMISQVVEPCVQRCPHPYPHQRPNPSPDSRCHSEFDLGCGCDLDSDSDSDCDFDFDCGSGSDSDGDSHPDPGSDYDYDPGATCAARCG